MSDQQPLASTAPECQIQETKGKTFSKFNALNSLIDIFWQELALSFEWRRKDYILQSQGSLHNDTHLCKAYIFTWTKKLNRATKTLNRFKLIQSDSKMECFVKSQVFAKERNACSDGLPRCGECEIFSLSFWRWGFVWIHVDCAHKYVFRKLSMDVCLLMSWMPFPHWHDHRIWHQNNTYSKTGDLIPPSHAATALNKVRYSQMPRFPNAKAVPSWCHRPPCWAPRSETSGPQKIESVAGGAVSYSHR